MTQATIHGVRVAAAHDGSAELIVSIIYENGAVSEITLDEIAGASLMKNCDALDPAQLKGQSWTKVKQALSVSYNRFKNA